MLDELDGDLTLDDDDLGTGERPPSEDEAGGLDLDTLDGDEDLEL